jgi:hypothetical protein
MAGYTPVFDSVYAGTLCGRWPTTAVWVTLLPLCDKHGHIDLSYQTICALTGWPLELLKQGISELMAPDPDSRSSAEDGRRLVLLDPETRAWGWKVVNHGLYREKARKLQYDAERTSSGRDAERKRMSREVPRSPDAPREVPLSDADADASKKPRKGRASRLPEDFSPDLEEARTTIPDLDAEAEFARFRDYWRAKSGANGTKADWPATWRNWIRNCKDSGRYARRKEAARASRLPVLNG